MSKRLKNLRHEKFALAMLKGSTQRQAAIDAGYSPRTCDLTASRLIRNDKIIARILELHQKTETEAVMDVAERKERLSEIARARLGDFVQVEEDGSIGIGLDLGHSAALQEVTVTEFTAVTDMPVSLRKRATRVKLHDPVKSIAELNRMDHVYNGEQGAPGAEIVQNFIFLLPDGTRLLPAQFQKPKEITSGDDSRETD